MGEFDAGVHFVGDAAAPCGVLLLREEDSDVSDVQSDFLAFIYGVWD
jgi:hypothetical protein